MSKTAVVTARLDRETADFLSEAAQRRGCTRSAYVARLVNEAAAREREFLGFVQEGIDELDRGEGIAHEAMMAELDAMIVDLEARCRA